VFHPRCVACASARNAGYDGCVTHNSARVRYVRPATTVVVTDTHHHHHGYFDDTPAVGVDVATGDAVLNLGGGLGVDMRTGDLEVNVGGGVYVDVDPSPSYDAPVSYDAPSSDW